MSLQRVCYSLYDAGLQRGQTPCCAPRKRHTAPAPWALAVPPLACLLVVEEKLCCAVLTHSCALQVQQVGWDNSLTPLCSLGNSNSPACLLAALADRLLIARGTPTGGVEVVQHYVPLLHPLLLGWATLAASNILPGALSGSAKASSGLNACSRWRCCSGQAAHQLQQSEEAVQDALNQHSGSAAGLQPAVRKAGNGSVTATVRLHHWPQMNARQDQLC